MNNSNRYEKAKRLVIHQPNFLPRLKVLQKIIAGDQWVVLDDVQFVIREWQNRSRIRFLKQPEKEFWITIPVHRPNGQKSLIKTIMILEPSRTKDNIYQSIWHAYRRSDFWDWIDEYSTTTLQYMKNDFTKICMQSTLICLSMLGIQRPTLLSSTLNTSGRKSGKLLEICEVLNAEVYLCGSGGHSYLNENAFRVRNIKVEFQSWLPPSFTSKDENVSWRDISFLDFVARYGPDALKEHLTSWKSESNK